MEKKNGTLKKRRTKRRQPRYHRKFALWIYGLKERALGGEAGRRRDWPRQKFSQQFRHRILQINLMNPRIMFRGESSPFDKKFPLLFPSLFTRFGRSAINKSLHLENRNTMWIQNHGWSRRINWSHGGKDNRWRTRAGVISKRNIFTQSVRSARKTFSNKGYMEHRMNTR